MYMDSLHANVRECPEQQPGKAELPTSANTNAHEFEYGTLLGTADTGISRTDFMKMYVYIYI